MNYNTVKKWLSFGLAISLLTGNTTVLQAEEEPVETEDLYEVTEDTESEAAAVETAAEENEIDPEAENQEVPEGSLKDASGMYEDVNDFETRALGSDGVQYDGVSYLSVGAVSRLPEESQDLYLQIADTIAESYGKNEMYKDAVIAVDGEGTIIFGFKSTTKELHSQNSFVYPEEETLIEETAPAEEVTEAEPEEVPAEAETAPEETVLTEEETPAEETPAVEEVPAEETPAVEEAPAEEEIVPETAEESEAVESAEETAEPEETEEAAPAEPETYEFVAENTSLIDLDEEEVIYEDYEEESVPFTVLQNEEYFYNQLQNGTQRSIFNKAKTSFVKNGKTSVSFGSSYYDLNYTYTQGLSALNALIVTYPNKFDWWDRGKGYEAYWKGYVGGHVTITVKLLKSSSYSKTLHNQAKAQVNSIVESAYTYANSNYPNNPTYGMAKYFDNWLCDHNYYNMSGTYSSNYGTAVYYFCHCAYGTLLKGYGVCESYALALNWLLDTAGIRNMYCVGDVTSGGHAWNYVQMPDGKWYLLDSTWNDDSSSKEFFLAGGSTMTESGRTASGNQWNTGLTLNFDSSNWATSNYSASATDSYFSQIRISNSKVALAPKKTFTLKAELPQYVSGVGSYYSKWPVTWTSSNPSVAKVSSSGKVTAVAPGTSIITMRIGGKKYTSTVYVYKFKNILFNENSKTKLTKAYAKSGTVYDGVISANFTSSDTATIALTANQSTYTTSAQNLVNSGLAVPTATSNKKSVAEVQNVSVSGDTIYVQVKANAIGTAKITVKFAGKKAVLTFTPKYQLNSSWFDSQSVVTSNTAGLTYAFKAYKPKVAKTYAAPSNLKFKTTYTNNKNAGTATITLTGTGNYTGTVTRTFNIAKADFTNAKITSVSSLKYTGTAKQPKMTVKIGKKTLNPKTDYIVYYSSYEYGSYSTTIPTAPGTYFVKVQGTGNFKSGVWSVNAKPFVIK
ncbi:MAG: Ig-like domain-containing protein [Lachnospiraceae bacterium]|nr:Ig-like domain-containing protein [Lachnospiraceae bacterium]